MTPVYPQLASILLGLKAPIRETDALSMIMPYVTHVWLADYARTNVSYDIIETQVDGFRYLFDLSASRLIAAWGLSRGKDHAPRSAIATRMQRHPLTLTVNGRRYHRGHAVPHTMGGRVDINLVPQLGSINSGRFQELERKAVATPGSLYFTYWAFAGSVTQRPCAVQQGVLEAGHAPHLATFVN